MTTSNLQIVHIYNFSASQYLFYDDVMPFVEQMHPVKSVITHLHILYD